MVSLNNEIGYQEFIENIFVNNENRKLHIYGVVKKMKEICKEYGIKETDKLFSDLVKLAYLHDIGYSDKINQLDFHAVDGYLYLIEDLYRYAIDKSIILGILYHTHSDILFKLISDENSEYKYSENAKNIENLYKELEMDRRTPYTETLIYFITLADMQVNSKGEIVTIEERIADVANRYGKDSVYTKHLTMVVEKLNKY